MLNESTPGSMVLIAIADIGLRTQIARIVAQQGMIALIAMHEEATAVAVQMQRPDVVCAIIDDLLFANSQPDALSTLHAAAPDLPLVILSESRIYETEQLHNLVVMSRKHTIIDLAQALDTIISASPHSPLHYDSVYTSY